MIPAYRDRDSLLHSLHPLAQLLLVTALVLFSLLSRNPFIQVSLILSTALLAIAAQVPAEWSAWWKVVAFIGVAAVIINPLVSREGATVIWRGPSLPVLGRLTISAEAIAYGFGMALGLAAIIWAFALLTLIMDPDRALGLLRGRGSRSALVSGLALRMVPTAMRDAGEILQAQRSRGIARDSGSRRAILRSKMPMVRKLVVTSLDRASSLAEAMESRAYGTCRRSRFLEYRFGPGGVLVLLFSLLLLGAGVAGAVSGSGSFGYYPSLRWSVGPYSMALLALPLLVSFLLLMMSWSWKRWAWLNLRT